MPDAKKPIQTMRACLMCDHKGNAVIRGQLYEGSPLPDALLRTMCADAIGSSGDAEEVMYACVDVPIPPWRPAKKKKSKKPDDEQGSLPGVTNE